MSTTLDFVTDLLRPGKDGAPALEPTFTAGLSDPLGDRLICFTEPGAASFELLRINPDVGDRPGFEAALRASVEALGRLDPCLATIQAVERIEELGGLTIVSVRESGRRLSDLMPRAGGPAYAVELIREIGPALALLHEAGHAHGALTPERIIVSREGHLVVLEHVLGAALGALALPGAQLRSTAGIAVPDRDGPVKVDARLDVVQLGFIALSLTTGQRLRPSDYPHFMTVLLDQFSRSDPDTAAILRPWLEGALQLGDRPFANASEALSAFRKLPTSLVPKAGDVPTAWPAAPAGEATAKEPVPETPTAAEREAPRDLRADREPRAEPRVEPASVGMFASVLPAALSNTAAGLRKAVAVLGAIVVLQTAIIAYLVLKGSATEVSASAGTAFAPSSWPEVTSEAGPSATDLTSNGRVAEPTVPSVPEQVRGPAPTGAPGAVLPAQVEPVPVPADPVPADPPAADPPAADPAPADPVPAPAEPGSVTVVSPIELQVFEGDTLLGSTGGPIALTAGTHTLDVANAELGFRARQTVTVAAGEAASITIAIPTGRVDINAVPWADVWIDGAAAGQTPLANVSLPIGRHEILFRHPQLGERREVAVVKVEGIARVSAVFQQQ